MKRKNAAALILVLAFALIAGACGGGTSGEYSLVTEGTLTVCSDIPYPPFEDEVGGEYVGIDVEIMDAIAGELGLEMAFVGTGFEAITTGNAMVAGDCDIAASAITIKPEREENVDFSEPYLEVDQSLLVPGDSGLTSLDGFAGLNLGVQSGTTGMDYALENAPADATILDFPTGGELFVALAAGQIDGILQDKPVNELRAEADPSVEIVQTYETNEEYGLAVQEEGMDTLLGDVNDAIAKFKSDGTFDAIFDKWFG
ncbi:MAG: transporter substrate-binding domain-containing protein [Acidimicrobiia bacterium]|nr:transporter substrate-binding domain-containing protein [Acidimicrobiia bacterium]MDH3396707.1 transporter substrate-binding domain-containing protein [Acidimicrobiia bacterium]MDH5615095.1 transporter substrate-binding domain-containing protein [Acidimicrobiia bacterium]